jgi:hypothetical protein
VKFISEYITSRGRVKICNLLNRYLLELSHFLHIMILTIFFLQCKYPFHVEWIAPRIIPYFIYKWKYSKLIWKYQCCWYATCIWLHNKFHVTLELTHQCGFSSYQFVSQGMLCLLPLIHIHDHSQCLMDIVMSLLVIHVITFLLFRNRDSLFVTKKISIWEEPSLIVHRNYQKFCLKL